MYQRRGDLLEAWQEERVRTYSWDLSRLSKNGMFAILVPEFQALSDTNGLPDPTAMAKTTQADPADPSKQVPCATYDQNYLIMMHILYMQMDFVKGNPLARPAETEIQIVFEYRHRGGANKGKTKTTLPSERKVRSLR